MDRWDPCNVVVLCGPGNNGGDGFVIARLLSQAGWSVDLALCGDRDSVSGDAGIVAALWEGVVQTLTPGILESAELVVAALFGAGLSRELDPELIGLLSAITCPCVAVDAPSGVDGDTGGLRGGACRAELTVTFCRKKPGHLLMPGKAHCGDIKVVDIGITDATIAGLSAMQWENAPELWNARWPWPEETAHKYSRGHLVVAGGGVASNGAVRLAARAGLRIGAGLVTCAVPDSALQIYAAQQTAVMNCAVSSPDAFREMIDDRRVTAALLGPGQGVHGKTREMVCHALETATPTVLDADALTVFQDDPSVLFERLHEQRILTPHEGEFSRLFKRTDDRLHDVRLAARQADCIVLLKGADTVIANPQGAVLINANGSPFLATAGSGDVLAGFVAGLLAQGAAAFDAAAMGVWLHAEIGRRLGPGLVAEDLTEKAPRVLRSLYRKHRHHVRKRA